MHKIDRDFEREPIFEAYDLYSHIKMRNALDIKTHPTPTQPQKYVLSHNHADYELPCVWQAVGLTLVIEGD